jgi:hypothetical protein
MKILLILPAAEHLRATGDSVPKRKMLRFSVLSLTGESALRWGRHSCPPHKNRRPRFNGKSSMKNTDLR